MQNLRGFMYLFINKKLIETCFCIMNRSEIINKLAKNIHQKPILYISINSYAELINYIIDELKLKSILQQQFSRFFARFLNLSGIVVDITYTISKLLIMLR